VTRAPRPIDYLVVPLLYFLAAKTAVTITVMPEGTAIVWPPNGVLLAAMIRFGGLGYFRFAGLTILAEVAVDVPAFSVVEAILFGIANVTEVSLAVALLSRWSFNPRFTTPADLLKFIVAGPLIAAFVAAMLGALVYSTFRGGATSYLEFLRVWWLGDAVGLTIVTPLLLGFWLRAGPLAARAIKLKPIDLVVAVGIAGALSLIIAAPNGTLFGMHVGPVLLVPFVIYIAVRFGVPGAAIAAASVALLIMILTNQGYQLFGTLTTRGTVISAQEFIFITSLVSLGPAALMAQLRASQQALVVVNSELRERAQELERSNHDLQRAEAEVVALNAGLEHRVRERTLELEQALGQVKRLQGLLPICAWCRKVRDDEDYWQSVEDYIVRHTDARFSHSICPDCAERLLRESAGKSA
jgi:integral membrane sensor domain MASE1